MNRTISITALSSGILLFLVPRFILPACEYQGFPAMHCSDTVRAEYVVGALLIALGTISLFVKGAAAGLASGSIAIILYGAAFMLPDKIGYCHSSKMPCNYGTVPGIRFVAVVSAIIVLITLIRLGTSYRKKGKA